MNAPVGADPPLLVPEMFQGPPGISRLIRLLRPFPGGIGAGALAAMALVDGVARRGRFSSAAQWARAQGAHGWHRRQLATALLLNHGRYVAGEALLGVRDVNALGARLRIEGREHVDAHRAALLVGFHLGPPKIWLALRAAGFPVIFAGNLSARARDPRWQRAIAGGVAVDLGDTLEQHTAAMLRIRKALQRDGTLCYLTADGPFGREAFRIDLPGRAMVIRAGWLRVRRVTHVPVIPVFTYESGGERMVVFHPALPEVDADPDLDAGICRVALAPLVSDYVRRFPSQCRWLAFEGGT